MAITCVGLAAYDSQSPLKEFTYELRELEDNEVMVEVHYCGISHTDVDMVHNRYGTTVYPLVPGHEIVGKVKQAGKSVKFLKEGDDVGVGYFAGTCGNCQPCHEGNTHFCEHRVTTVSQRGGYGQYVIVKEDFVTKIPSTMDLATAGPLFSSGIILYSCMAENNMQRGGLKIGVLGVGGMGHLAIQFASKMNASNEVYGIELNGSKAEDARKLGATGFLVLNDQEVIARHGRFFDYIIDTVADEKDYVSIEQLLKARGSIIVAAPGPGKLTIAPFPIILGCHIVQAAGFGCAQRMSEMLDFCLKHGIRPVCENVSLEQVNDAHSRLQRGDVKFKFVVNMPH